MSYIITAQGDTRPYLPAVGEQYTLEELQAAVGGYIEIVHLDADRVMVLNEEGIRLRLGVNAGATDLCGQAILGDVLVCPHEAID